MHGSKIVKNDACKRIDFLIKNHLKKIGTDKTGWNTLYLNLEDGRYWELTYLENQLHGGGPPSLINLKDSELSEYNL